MPGRPIARSVAAFTVLASWLLATGVFAAGSEGQGALVHVADIRHLSGFNLYLANLYNVNRWLFTTVSISITGAMGLTLGLLMDALVNTIGLNLSQRDAKE